MVNGKTTFSSKLVNYRGLECDVILVKLSMLPIPNNIALNNSVVITPAPIAEFALLLLE